MQVDHFRIPLPVVLSDSTHGEMSHFGLVTVRIDRADGEQGLGTPTASATSAATPFAA